MKIGPLTYAAFCAQARSLGERLRGGELLLLNGSMGAGKTTFTRALAEGLKVDNPGRVRSPTFALCVTYPGPVPLMHLDLYRLDGTDGIQAAAFEALGLEFDELVAPDRVVVVEWASRWTCAPREHLRLDFEIVGEAFDQRQIVATPCGQLASEVLSRWLGNA